MPGDLLCRPLIEIAADLREKRVTAWELTEAAIGRHERFRRTAARLLAMGAGAGPTPTATSGSTAASSATPSQSITSGSARSPCRSDAIEPACLSGYS